MGLPVLDTSQKGNNMCGFCAWSGTKGRVGGFFCSSAWQDTLPLHRWRTSQSIMDLPLASCWEQHLHEGVDHSCPARGLLMTKFPVLTAHQITSEAKTRFPGSLSLGWLDLLLSMYHVQGSWERETEPADTCETCREAGRHVVEPLCERKTLHDTRKPSSVCSRLEGEAAGPCGTSPFDCPDGCALKVIRCTFFRSEHAIYVFGMTVSFGG
eukprot:XP_017456936.1 PREDICTED: uncharacterized protein LOC108348955 [Rattus norvegicus]